MAVIYINADTWRALDKKAQTEKKRFSEVLYQELNKPAVVKEVVKEVIKTEQVEVVKYACPDCDRTFDRIRDVNYHYTVIHEKKR